MAWNDEQTSRFDSFTIEESSDRGRFEVWGHGVYPESSVLAGQSRRSLIESFATPQEAKWTYPEAEVIEGSTRPYRDPDASLAELSGLPECPPDWFDEADAGETW